ncbi:MAG: GNAT family N-acetyltransferase [Gemmatimonadetes bacterium]|nr:GNAT family N-acetyltransferase [Gemmatimonadota bacterium]MBT7859717.1 GNAT family N-acetyltransferase [Gemmatimonadota bacterium]
MDPVDVTVVGVERLLPLFKPDTPNRALLYSVLEGQNRAVVVVDDAENPCSCLLRTSVFGFTFYATQDPAFLSEAISVLRQIGDLVMIASQAGADVEPPANVDKRIKRLEFLDRDVLGSVQPSVPSGCEFMPITSELLERCEWGDEFNDTCNAPAAFYDRSPGICLMRGDDILCEAYAAWWGNRIVEIGVVTPVRHRRMGYGASTCEHLARSCESLGCATTWTCDEDNAGSMAIARKLGFRTERPYEQLVYRQHND